MKNLYKVLLSLLGFSTVACNIEINPPAMYGTPTVKLTVKGQVTDADTGAAIPGIQVSLDQAFENGNTQTNIQGEFVLTSRVSQWDEHGVKYRFSDVDGPLNGVYADKELSLIFDNQTEQGDDGWYIGAYERTGVKVVLSQTEPAKRKI